MRSRVRTRGARARRRRAVPWRPRRCALAEDGARPQRRERLLAVLVVGAVDDQHAREVVELVLDDPRGVLVELEPEVLAARILSLEDEARRAFHRHTDSLQREATLVLRRRLVAALGDDGVD